ncbi:MAG TPA: hypothetical protein VFE37_03535 [Chloroflexota bacterium]|nr:hypothetical protein [Chloroflexota bacterium]
MSRHPSVQSTRLRLEAIDDDVVCLTGGEYRAVLEVGSVNFGLQGERQQEVLVASYAAFLNSLTFPVQVLVRVLPLDLDRYLGDLERRARDALPEPMAELARDHAAFLRRLARNRTLLERRFYLVVPAGRDATGPDRGWRLLRRAPALDLAAARRQLTVRCEEIARQLGRCELSVRRLRSVELAQLYHACWCPELARVQRLRRDLAEYTALVVRADNSNERRD